MTFCQFLMFHDFSMTILIFQDFQVFQSLWETCFCYVWEPCIILNNILVISICTISSTTALLEC